jgi:hypothetical protein
VPAGAAGALRISTPEGASVDRVTLNTGSNAGTKALAGGQYLVQVRLEKGGRYAGLTEALHIYPGLISDLPRKTYTEDNFAEKPIPVSGVSLDQTELTMALGGTAVLQATVSPDNAANKGLSWLSSRTDVVTVEDGVLSAQGTGAARITVRTDEGNKVARCMVTVWNFLQSIGAMDSWLAGLPVNSYATAYYIALSDVELSEKSGGGGLKALFVALAGKGKYVTLDLDACTGATVGWSETPGGHENWSGKDTLVQVVLPASATHIGYWAFANCVSLESVVMPASIKAIGQYAFQGCTSLKSVTVLAGTPPKKGNSNIGWFTGADSLTIYVPPASVNTYKAAEGWSAYAARIRAIE